MRLHHLAALSLALMACGPLDPSEREGPAAPSTITEAPVVNAAPRPPEAPPPRSPELLATLLEAYDRKIAEGASAEEIARARTELDRVAGQRDAYTSRLYWYTDLELAKTEARRTGRPILSLHLLGHLDDELSCANSRFFRIMLYANPRVGAFLRDNYVLHWQSERPVPQITIDYGDGRKITQTITGNSIHYVLDAEGRVIDGLPGLYGPTEFQRGLEESLELAKKSKNLDDAESQKLVAKHHAQMVWRLTARWRTLLHKAYGDTYGDVVDTASLPGAVDAGKWPDPLWSSLPASVVNALTMSKADTEAPPLALMQPEIYVGSPWDGWTKIADKLPASRLDPVSRAFIASKHPRDFGAKDAAPLDAAALDKRFAYFEKRLAEESARNEFAFHAAIHEHLRGKSRVPLDALDNWVYSKIFMTPASDPWLGLMPTSALTGIAEDGVVTSPAP